MQGIPLWGWIAFAGIKIIIDEWVPIHPLATVGITAMLIGGAVWTSLLGGKNSNNER